MRVAGFSSVAIIPVKRVTRAEFNAFRRGKLEDYEAGTGGRSRVDAPSQPRAVSQDQRDDPPSENSCIDQDLLGPDILCLNPVFFIKEPMIPVRLLALMTGHYWGLDFLRCSDRMERYGGRLHRSPAA